MPKIGKQYISLPDDEGRVGQIKKTLQDLRVFVKENDGNPQLACSVGIKNHEIAMMDVLIQNKKADLFELQTFMRVSMGQEFREARFALAYESVERLCEGDNSISL